MRFNIVYYAIILEGEDIMKRKSAEELLSRLDFLLNKRKALEEERRIGVAELTQKLTTIDNRIKVIRFKHMKSENLTTKELRDLFDDGKKWTKTAEAILSNSEHPLNSM